MTCSTHGYAQSGSPPITVPLDREADDFMCPIGQIEAATEKALAEIALAKGAQAETPVTLDQIKPLLMPALRDIDKAFDTLASDVPALKDKK